MKKIILLFLISLSVLVSAQVPYVVTVMGRSESEVVKALKQFSCQIQKEGSIKWRDYQIAGNVQYQIGIESKKVKAAIMVMEDLSPDLILQQVSTVGTALQSEGFRFNNEESKKVNGLFYVKGKVAVIIEKGEKDGSLKIAAYCPNCN